MSIDVTHAFVSPVVDQANPDEVGPDEWNAQHSFTMASGFFLGRLSASAGAVEELTLTSFGASLMALADATALAALVDPAFLTEAEADLLYAPIGSGGTGDVVGPASAVNERIAVFDGTTGKLIKDGGVLVADLQPIDSDLTAISGLATAIYGRSLLTLASATALAAEVDSFFLTPTEGDAAYQPKDATLTALAAFNTNGILVQTAADTFAGRTITGTTDQVNVSQGNGVAGNPTLSLPQSIAVTSTVQFGAIELGHATQNTLTGSGGNLSIEGNVVYRAGGTDVPVVDGGTGVSALTAFAVLCGGTTTTGAIQALAALGSAGNVLTSNGAGALPSFQAPAGGGITTVNIQVFTASGTYTPTAGMDYCIVISTGGGGGGGGADVNSSTNQVGVSAGGGAGGTCIEFFSAATIGASQTVTIGAAGTAGSATNGANGGAGGDTTFGALHTATGGPGGTGSGVANATSDTTVGVAGGVPTGGTLNITGGGSSSAAGLTVNIGGLDTFISIGSIGGGSFWGGGGRGGVLASETTVTASQAGTAAAAFGAGGGGAVSTDSAGVAGGAGAAGVCIVIEFI